MSSCPLIDGFGEPADDHAKLLDGSEWIDRAAWRRWFRRAWLIEMRNDMFVTWRTAALPDDLASQQHGILVWDMGLGSFSSLPQPTGRFDIEVNGHQVISICDQPGNRFWQKGDCRFYYEIKRHEGRATFGLGYLMVPASLLCNSKQATVKVTASDCDSESWFMVCEYGEGCLARGVSFCEPNAAAAFVDDGVQRVTAGRQRQTDGPFNLYWGDLHVHSSMANYIDATPQEDYEYARHVSNLDFVAITDQEHFLTEQMFAHASDLANNHDDPDRFVAFVAYEWSSRRYGHRNVIFRGDRGVLVRRHDVERPYDPPYPRERSDSFDLLRSGLKKFAEPCMLLPHHPAMTSMGAFDWSHFDAERDCAVEMYSLWGSSEHKSAPGRSLRNDERPGSFVHDALARGYRLGIIASGESGDGHPGNSQWRRGYARKAGIALSPLGGGLAAVWGEQLTRAGLFDALRARRCYGTTSSRIILRFKANDHWMGSDIPVSEDQLKAGLPIDLDIYVAGEVSIGTVHLFRNGEMIHCLPGYGRELSRRHGEILRLEDCMHLPAGRFAYFYVRIIMNDGHMAWSSSVWFTVKS